MTVAESGLDVSSATVTVVLGALSLMVLGLFLEGKGVGIVVELSDVVL